MESKKTRIYIFLLRVFMGLMFLYSGFAKLLSDFTATGYLNNSAGPFREVFVSIAGSDLVDFLVIYGEIGIGVSLLLGVLLRFGSVCGIIMMVLFYVSSIPQKTGPISNHVIYILILVLFIGVGAGRYLGLDKYLERVKFVKNNSYIFRLLLG